jgi:hypothetical protein
MLSLIHFKEKSPLNRLVSIEPRLSQKTITFLPFIQIKLLWVECRLTLMVLKPVRNHKQGEFMVPIQVPNRQCLCIPSH